MSIHLINSNPASIVKIKKNMNLFESDYSCFDNLDSNTIKLQRCYLKYRKNSELSFVNFNEKLLILKTLMRTIDTKILTNNELNIYAWNALGLLELFLLFTNKEVTEVFSSQLEGPLYITHMARGHCYTNFNFTNNLWRAIKRQVEHEANQFFNLKILSIKCSWTTEIGNFRLSVEIPPLTVNSPSFIIRRIPQNSITMEKLIEDGQISLENAEYLVNAISARQNIIIAGEPGSGKTTLANALLHYCDPSWRLIILEDAREISLKNHLQNITYYSIPTLGENSSIISRDHEIKKILHRSPDYVFLGEIQTESDTHHTFEGFAAGIRGIATTHCKNFENLMLRWNESHHLSLELVNSIDYIVITKREFREGKFYLSVEEVRCRKDNVFRQI